MKKTVFLLLALIIALSCFTAAFAELEPCELPNAPVPVDVLQDMFTNRDRRTEYSIDTDIMFDGESCTVNGSGASWDGKTLIISAEGCYRLSGRLDNGQIKVNADPNAKIQLVFDNAEVNSSESAAVLAESADKVFISTADSSTNLICSTAKMKDKKIDAAVYSECDLTFNGKGFLRAVCDDGHGILTKDDLKICSGKYEIVSHKQGISGKDSVRICGGDIMITSERDGIHSEHTRSNKGYVLICGGNIEIASGKDGIYASGPIRITDGSLNVSSGESVTAKEGASRVCIRSDTMFVMYGGSVDAHSADDIVKCPAEPQILGGRFVFK